MNEKISSIRFPFAIDAALGTLMDERDYPKHVKQLMLQVLFTNPGERINRPDFGCGLRKMVFAPNSEATASLLQVLIMQSLERWLGKLIEINKITVKALGERLEVNIVYVIKAKQQQDFLNVEV